MAVSMVVPSVEIPAIFCPFMYVCRGILDMTASFWKKDLILDSPSTQRRKTHVMIVLAFGFM